MLVSSRQYRNVLFYHDERQRVLAAASLIAMPRDRGRVQTVIEPAGVFTRAEDYHQKFYLRAVASVYEEIYSYYPTDREFVDSTAAARLNGYFGGNGSLELFEAESHLYGLSDEALAIVRDRAEAIGVDCGPQK